MRLVLVAVLLAGCYAPSIDDCQYRCSADPTRPCPSGMFCNGEFFCVSDQSISCEGMGPDGGMGSDGSMPGDSGPPMDGLTPDAMTMPDGGLPIDAVAGTPSELVPVGSIREAHDDVSSASEPALVDEVGLATPR